MKQKRKLKLWQKILLAVLLVLALLLAAAFFMLRRVFTAQTIDTAPASDRAVVQTEQGALRGSLDNGIYQYLGVAYAQANERFVPAEPVQPWEGVRDATECGPMSPQTSIMGPTMGSQDGTDNNCQNLNLWTPGIEDGGKRAVMVWLHGGGFSSGSGNDASYNGAELSRAGDVVVVSVNHRLGAFGFLDLSAYGEKYRYSANAGVTDIVNALQWIHDNIEHFGGDPDNVTLFGQSGGGAKVLSMMTSPYAKGLFRRGIVQSGATETLGVTFTTQEASTHLTEHILEELNLTADNIEALQTVSVEDLNRAATTALQATANEFQIPAALGGGYSMEWEPVIDGDYIPSGPVTEDGFAQAGEGIDLLIGTNLNEWAGFMGQGQSEPGQQVQDAYAAAYPGKDAAAAGQVDTLLRLPTLKIMSHKADQNNGAVYSYVFTYDATGRGVGHGAEIPYVFRHVSGAGQTVAEQVSDVWINFAKTGVPSAQGLPVWEPYDRERAATMILDAESVLVYGHDRELMHLLAPDYTW